MKSIIAFLSSLQQAKYLSFNRNSTGIFDLKLEENGLKLQSLLLKIWQSNNDEWMQINPLPSYKYYMNDYENRTSFMNCKQFYENHTPYYKLDDAKPAIIKTIGMVEKDIICDNFITLKPASRTLLISDYFVKASKGLEKFYNLQRKRKIWWMLNAANPSNFFIEAFNTSPFEAEIDQNYPSVAIQVQFPFGALYVESLTYIPLKHSHNQFVEPISCIRSSIALETSTFVMLLNAIASNRNEALLLNRKLVPYQCYISHINKGTESNPDVNDLYLHITHMLERAGLRLYPEDIRLNSKHTLGDELKNSDRYGIPYTLLIGNDSLNTGFLKLRSRDTTLMETIHLSDLPMYLLNILNV